MKRYGVALVGCGTVAGYGHLPAIVSSGRARLVGVVDLIPERGKSYAERFRAEHWSAQRSEIIGRDDVDIVVVTTWPSSHAEIVIESLETGKHVLCEKPMARTLKEARAMIEKTKAAGKKLLIGYILRYNVAYQMVKQIIAQGDLGRPLVLNMRGAEGPRTQWAWERDLNLLRDTSPLIDCGCHYVDVMRWFTGAEAVGVSGVGARLNPDVPGDNYNFASILVQMGDGSRGIYEVGWGPQMRDFSIKEFTGPKGFAEIVYEELEEGKERVNCVKYYSPRKGQQRHILGGEQKPFTAQFSRLIEMIEKDLDPIPGLMDAMKSLEIVLAGDRAIKTGETVSLKAYSEKISS